MSLCQRELEARKRHHFTDSSCRLDGRPLLGTSNFPILIGKQELGFCEVTRLTSETDLAAPLAERGHRFATVVLRRALSRSTELYDCRRAARARVAVTRKL